MKHDETFYERLGVPEDATAEQLRAGWRTVARRTHPDVAGPDQAEAFRAAQEAWAVLSDPDRRAAYDRTLAVSRGMRTSSTSNTSDSSTTSGSRSQTGRPSGFTYPGGTVPPPTWAAASDGPAWQQRPFTASGATAGPQSGATAGATVAAPRLSWWRRYVARTRFAVVATWGWRQVEMAAWLFIIAGVALVQFSDERSGVTTWTMPLFGQDVLVDAAAVWGYGPVVLAAAAVAVVTVAVQWLLRHLGRLPRLTSPTVRRTVIGAAALIAAVPVGTVAAITVGNFGLIAAGVAVVAALFFGTPTSRR